MKKILMLILVACILASLLIGSTISAKGYNSNIDEWQFPHGNYGNSPLQRL